MDSISPHLPMKDSALTLIDTTMAVNLKHQETVFEGRIWDVRQDRVTLPRVDNGKSEELVREYIDHPGAVAVVALDESHKICLINQYRHPVKQRLWELPAGLLEESDVDGQTAAARELTEETDIVAEHWEALIDLYPSPGSTSELIKIYLARGLSRVSEAQRYQRTGEESQLMVQWVALDEAIEAVLAGAIRNATAQIGIFAAYRYLSAKNRLVL